ncbi:MAG: hypothetical protein IIA05_08460 [Proteobacteria bacterium]|nr:hypothetical protein [Pseudomonadota bacterium]
MTRFVEKRCKSLITAQPGFLKKSGASVFPTLLCWYCRLPEKSRFPVTGRSIRASPIGVQLCDSFIYLNQNNHLLAREWPALTLEPYTIRMISL